MYGFFPKDGPPPSQDGILVGASGGPNQAPACFWHTTNSFWKKNLNFFCKCQLSDFVILDKTKILEPHWKIGEGVRGSQCTTSFIASPITGVTNSLKIFSVFLKFFYLLMTCRVRCCFGIWKEMAAILFLPFKNRTQKYLGFSMFGSQLYSTMKTFLVFVNFCLKKIKITLGIWNPDQSRFWIVKKRLG